nr:hypothetical protein [Tanacetum cinerariifolium]
MHTRSSSNLPGEYSPNPTSSNPKRRNRRRSKKPFILKEYPVDTMVDQRTMAELLRATIEGYAEAIVVPLILAEQFELKHSLINMMTSDQFFGLEKYNPHDHIRCNPPPASVKVVEEICVTCSGAHPYFHCLVADGNIFLEFRDNIQGYVSAVLVNYNQGNSGYRPPGVANKIQPSGFAQPNAQNNQNQFSQPQGYNRGNNFNQNQSYQAPTQKNQVVPLTSMSNQTNELKNMMASFFQMNTASTLGSGPLPSNTIANPKGELKSITTRSGIVLDGPSVLIPPPLINPKEDERVEETLTEQDLAEYTIKVPPPLVQKYKPPSQRNFVVHQRDPLHPNIPYPSRMHKQKQQEKDEKMLKDVLSSKEKLLELVNTPLNENCSVVILKKLPEKLGDPGKFLILCGFSELKCKALVDLAGIARDVFVPVGKFTFSSDFVIVDYESDPRVPLILGRPFLRTAYALIDVYGEEMILHDGDERLTLNMRHDTSSFSNQPQKESINMIKIFNDSSEDFLEDLFETNHLSVESDTEYAYDDPFDSKGEKIKESKLLIDELDLPRSSDFLPSPEYDSFLFENFSKVDALPSTNNKDK